jgi:hypothetical protein
MVMGSAFWLKAVCCLGQNLGRVQLADKLHHRMVKAETASRSVAGGIIINDSKLVHKMPA